MSVKVKAEDFRLRGAYNLSLKRLLPHVFPQTTNVPEPSAILLLGFGLVGLVANCLSFIYLTNAFVATIFP